jgi:hypothetical protein
MKYFLLLISLLVFSFWLMFHTFSYDYSSHDLLVSAKVFSDFGSHLPQIRSFSLGQNWPPQYPLFPGEKTRYHFLFYAFVGSLEKIGLGIDYALNIPSALGFFVLGVMILVFSTLVFSSFAVGFLSVIFFLFNGSFSFLDFIHKYPESLKNFASFGPWNGSLISAFWTLNIYTNQRHLALSYAIGLLISLILIQQNRKYYFFIGFLAGSLLLLNQAVFFISALFIFWYFLIDSRSRQPLLFSGLGFIPWLLITRNLVNISPGIIFHPGYLLSGSLNPASFIQYWFLNLGFHSILIPLSFIFLPRRLKLFAVPLLGLFIVANLWQFSPDMINNHKLFNYFIILGSMFSATVIVRLWKKNIFVSLFLSFILTLGGITDLFPVIYDSYIPIPDRGADPDIDYIISNTPPGAVILNSFWFYHPASLAGRPIFNGYSYFTWSYGYNQSQREAETVAIYSATDKRTACNLLLKNHISYVELSPRMESFIHPNFTTWSDSFIPVYKNSDTNLVLFDVHASCQN